MLNLSILSILARSLLRILTSRSVVIVQSRESVDSISETSMTVCFRLSSEYLFQLPARRVRRFSFKFSSKVSLSALTGQLRQDLASPKAQTEGHSSYSGGSVDSAIEL
ncbi:MAG TPA: hypothetical protein VF599_12385 [Pyrinomonadaceae bacterium]